MALTPQSLLQGPPPIQGPTLPPAPVDMNINDAKLLQAYKDNKISFQDFNSAMQKSGLEGRLASAQARTPPVSTPSLDIPRPPSETGFTDRLNIPPSPAERGLGNKDISQNLISLLARYIPGFGTAAAVMRPTTVADGTLDAYNQLPAETRARGQASLNAATIPRDHIADRNYEAPYPREHTPDRNYEAPYSREHIADRNYVHPGSSNSLPLLDVLQALRAREQRAAPNSSLPPMPPAQFVPERQAVAAQPELTQVSPRAEERPSVPTDLYNIMSGASEGNR